MSLEQNDKIKLLTCLYEFKDTIKIDRWNEYTENWSKGFKKGF